MVNKKRVFLTAIFLGVVVALGCFLTGCGDETVDLMQYAKVTFTGFNSKGEADIEVNLDELMEKASKNAPDDLKATGISSGISAFRSTFSYKLSKYDDLSNGEKIIMTVSYNERLAKAFKFNFKAENKEIEVTGLSEAQEVDLFDGVTVRFSGKSPQGTAKVIKSDKDLLLKKVYYSLNKADGLANGDTVIVTAGYSENEAEENGIIVGKTEKKFTVEGLDEYISKYEQMDKTLYDKMDKQARDMIDAKIADDSFGHFLKGGYVASDYSKGVSDLKVEADRCLFGSLKEGADKDYNIGVNTLSMVYKITGKDKKDEDGFTTYVSVRFSDIILLSDGKLDVVVTDGKLDGKCVSYVNIFRKVVTSNKDKYSFEEIDITKAENLPKASVSGSNTSSTEKSTEKTTEKTTEKATEESTQSATNSSVASSSSEKATQTATTASVSSR